MVAFVDTLYESDSGEIHPIRLTPAYAAVAGTPPTGPATSDINAKVTKANTEFGIRPRRVRLSRTVGTAPDTFRRYATLAVLTLTDFNSAAFAKGATITIDGIAYTIIGKEGEDF